MHIDFEKILANLKRFADRQDICVFEPLREINEDENKMIFEDENLEKVIPLINVSHEFIDRHTAVVNYNPDFSVFIVGVFRDLGYDCNYYCYYIVAVVDGEVHTYRLTCTLP